MIKFVALKALFATTVWMLGCLGIAEAGSVEGKVFVSVQVVNSCRLNDGEYVCNGNLKPQIATIAVDNPAIGQAGAVSVQTTQVRIVNF